MSLRGDFVSITQDTQFFCMIFVLQNIDELMYVYTNAFILSWQSECVAGEVRKEEGRKGMNNNGKGSQFQSIPLFPISYLIFIVVHYWFCLFACVLAKRMSHSHVDLNGTTVRGHIQNQLLYTRT